MPRPSRSLDISEKALGPDHPSVATALNNLAGVYVDQDRPDKAVMMRWSGEPMNCLGLPDSLL